jgi:hypothetical protein
MKYIINKYFYEKSLKENSDNFTKGVEFVLNEMGFNVEEKTMDCSGVENLIFYNKNKKSIDCKKTLDYFFYYFLEYSPKNGTINICYLNKPLISENGKHGNKKVQAVAAMDVLSKSNNLPFLSNVLVNSCHAIPESVFLLTGMHETAKLFDFGNCNNDELCILKKNKKGYNDCFMYYERKKKIPLCNSHAAEFADLKKNSLKNVY